MSPPIVFSDYEARSFGSFPYFRLLLEMNDLFSVSIVTVFKKKVKDRTQYFWLMVGEIALKVIIAIKPPVIKLARVVIEYVKSNYRLKQMGPNNKDD